MSETRTEGRTMETASATATQADRRPLSIVLVAVVALLLGALGGYVLRGSSDDASAYASGGGDLTERQEEMVQVVEDYVVAIQNGNVETIMGLYGPTATVLDEYSNADGTLAEYWTDHQWTGFELREPMLVTDDGVVFEASYLNRTGTVFIGFQPGNVGPVRIVSHELL